MPCRKNRLYLAVNGSKVRPEKSQRHLLHVVVREGLKSVINLLWEPSTFLVCGLFCMKNFHVGFKTDASGNIYLTFLGPQS